MRKALGDISTPTAKGWDQQLLPLSPQLPLPLRTTTPQAQPKTLVQNHGAPGTPPPHTHSLREKTWEAALAGAPAMLHTLTPTSKSKELTQVKGQRTEVKRSTQGH